MPPGSKAKSSAITSKISASVQSPTPYIVPGQQKPTINPTTNIKKNIGRKIFARPIFIRYAIFAHHLFTASSALEAES